MERGVYRVPVSVPSPLTVAKRPLPPTRLTTRAAVLRWIEASASNDTLGRAIEGEDADALAKAINSGQVRVKAIRAMPGSAARAPSENPG